MTRHFLDLSDCSSEDLITILSQAATPTSKHLEMKSVAMVFEKPSVRTRNSTEMAVVDLDGHAVMITSAEVGIDTRESAADVARTLGSYHRIIAARVDRHATLERMRSVLDAGKWNVSVVNLLSDYSHPCQAIADVLTMMDEYGGDQIAALTGKTLCYVGDGNNVTLSLAQACIQLGINVRVASPQGYQLSRDQQDTIIQLGQHSGASFTQYDDPIAAVEGANVLYADVWTSMGQEAEQEQRRRDLAGYSITTSLLDNAESDAIVLHCLPAHRGEEIDDEVLEGPHSRIWKQVAHRRTAMRGVFRWILDEEQE